MASEAIVSVITEKLADMLIQEAKFLGGVKDQVKWIKAELQRMQCFLKDADEKQEGDARVKNWVAEIREVCYDAEDIIDNLVLKKEAKKARKTIKKLTSAFSDLASHHKLGKEIEQIKNRIRDIRDSRETYGIENLGVTGEASGYAVERLKERRRTSPFFNQSDIVGLDDDLRTLESKLFDKESKQRVISIVGMGGLGKTTLAKKVYNSKDIESHFEFRAWVYVSQVYAVKQLLVDIAKQILGFDAGSLTIEQIEERMSDFLKEKRYLIVMDDVWSIDAWESVEAAFPNTGDGSRVLITTRNNEVALKAEPKSSPHELKLLNEENSWKLFLKKVGVEEDCPPNLEEVGKQIVKKCGGLPLAIVVLGGLLSTKEADYSTWSKLLQRFSWQLKQDQTQCSKILEMSYNDLPPYLKPCFIYFSLFPEDYEISIRRLTGLWLAEGLVQHRGDEELEGVAEDYIEELIERSIIQIVERRSDGKIKTCRMHDLIRDLSLLKAKEAKFLHTLQDIESASTVEHRIRRYAAHFKVDKCPSSINHLRSYLVFNSRIGGIYGDLVWKFLDDGLEKKGFRLLRVLDLEGVFQPKLPEEISQLIHLRYLGLRRTNAGALPSSLGSLRNLQTLDIKHSKISISSRPIWQLQKLRHLYMNGEVMSKIMAPPSSSSGNSLNLRNLQTLWGVYIDEETCIEGGLDNSIFLKKLKVQGDLAAKAESFANWLAKLDRLEVLVLRPSVGSDYPYRLPKLMPFSNNKHLYRIEVEGRFADKCLDLNEFPTNLTMLTLNQCKLERDSIATLQKLPNLKILTLLSFSYVENQLVCSSGGFKQLQVLKIKWLGQLENWKLEEGAMRRLVKLELVGCKNLQMLPEGLQHIKSLQELKLERMPEQFMTRIQQFDGADWYKIEHIPSVIIKDM